MKILHLVDKGGSLRQTADGYLESLAWSLDDEESTADFVALHKQKSQRSWKGGRVIGVREATDEERSENGVANNHQRGTIVVQFEPLRSYVI